ncbi:MAG: hypothetical protein ABIE94_00705 [archaeon]
MKMRILRTVGRVALVLSITYFAARGCADALKAAEFRPSELESQINNTEIDYKMVSDNPVHDYDVLEEYR